MGSFFSKGQPVRLTGGLNLACREISAYGHYMFAKVSLQYFWAAGLEINFARGAAAPGPIARASGGPAVSPQFGWQG